MIVRTWKAIINEVNEPQYRRLVNAKVLPYFTACKGYQGCKFARRVLEDDTVEILVMTFWDSMASVDAFSGKPGAHAYLPEDIADTLESYDSASQHFEVFIEE